MPSNFQCPCCGAIGGFHKVAFKPRFGFTIRAPIQCATCNAVVVQPSSVFVRATTTILSVAGAVYLVYNSAIPAVLAFAEDTASIRTGAKLFLDLIALYGLFVIVTVAVRAGKVRILSEHIPNDVQSSRV